MMHRGFTLIEALVVVAMTIAIVVASSTAIQYFYRSNEFLLEQTTALDSARQGILAAVHALREASYGDDGSYPIASAATSSLTFYSDIDNSGAVEKISLYLSGTTLYESVTKSAGSPPSYTGQTPTIYTIATYVKNPSTTPLFLYYDTSGNQLATSSTNVASVASVNITLMTDVNPNRAPNIFTLTEGATLRNLRGH